MRRHQRLWVKVGSELREWDRDRVEITDEEVLRYLVHGDGRLRVPVLTYGPLLIRGFLEALYVRTLLDPQP